MARSVSDNRKAPPPSSNRPSSPWTKTRSSPAAAALSAEFRDIPRSIVGKKEKEEMKADEYQGLRRMSTRLRLTVLLYRPWSSSESWKKVMHHHPSASLHSPARARALHQRSSAPMRTCARLVRSRLCCHCALSRHPISALPAPQLASPHGRLRVTSPRRIHLKTPPRISTRHGRFRASTLLHRAGRLPLVSPPQEDLQ